MKFVFNHNNINVFDLDKSLAFYAEALGLVEVKRKTNADFTLVYLGDQSGPHQLELTHLKQRKVPYELGDNESHIAFCVDDYEGAHAKHQAIGCICFENEEMGIYFINDPDDYWIEIIPEHR